MANPNGKRLIGLCSLAVTAIYAAGYLYTQPAMQANASGSPLPLTNSASASTGAHPNSAPPNHAKPTSGHSTTKTSRSASHSSKSTSHSSKSTSHSSKGASTHTKKNNSSHKAGQKKSIVYKDGTYTGFGSNPYGTLSVALHVQHGKIASVKITNYTMHYPQSFIDPQLPQETVSMQTWRIYIVSGATASSYNFAEAVYYALKKASA